MAAFTKFHSYELGRCRGVHKLHSDDLKVYLSNTAPDVATMVTKADLDEITAENGYEGPISIGNSIEETDGVVSLSGATDIEITATGDIGPFRYVVLYNDTPDTPVVDPLIGHYDYGESATIHEQEKLIIPVGQVLEQIS